MYQVTEDTGHLFGLKVTGTITGRRLDFERVAVVGDARWERWITEIGGRLISGETRSFDAVERNQAWDWIRSGSLERGNA